MFDPGAVEAASGWKVHYVALTASTMDEAARRRAKGAGPRTVVVAEAQSAGRGRAGRPFASPAGGLYASLLVGVGPLDVPGPLVAASALAVAEALEESAGVVAALKWPNDVWIGGRKVGGILLESAGGAHPLVTVGVGVNVRSVPPDLPADVRRGLTALDAEAGRAIPLETLLSTLLARIDRRLADLRAPASRSALAAAWSARLVLKGERVTWTEAGARRTGRFLDAVLDEGLEVVDDARGHRRIRAEHIQDLRAQI
jgi:BirA family biotin operon repressor/biotin-[acetyl-CoA-carboxylase] ligase